MIKSEEKIDSGKNKIENIAKKESINEDKTKARKIHIVKIGDTITTGGGTNTVVTGDFTTTAGYAGTGDHVTGGSGADKITGNKYKNNIQGNGGNDTIDGGDGYDIITQLGLSSDWQIIYDQSSGNFNLINGDEIDQILSATKSAIDAVTL